MKFLVTGSTGFVGRQLTRDLLKSGQQVYTAYHKTRPDLGMPISMDIERDDDIESTIQQVRPDVIFHCAAMTLVDLCETQKEMADRINHSATETISRQAARLKSFLVYMSTDYVFDGDQGMRRESDTPNPISYYGITKLKGEQAVQNIASKWAIARTCVPYGTHPTRKDFLAHIVDAIRQRKEYQVTNDQHICPTYLPNLSQMLIEIGTRNIAGIIHLAGKTRISRYDMAKMLVEKLEFDTNLLKPVKMSEIKSWIAKRPRDSSLDTSKASKILKEKPLSFEQGLELYVKQLKARALS